MSDEIKFPNYKSAFYFGMVFCVFFALGMWSFFADSSSPLFNFIKSAENFKDYSYHGRNHTEHISRKYVFLPFCMMMSAIGMFGVCFSLSPTETLTKFKHMFKEVFRNFKPK